MATTIKAGLALVPVCRISTDARSHFPRQHLAGRRVEDRPGHGCQGPPWLQPCGLFPAAWRPRGRVVRGFGRSIEGGPAGPGIESAAARPVSDIKYISHENPPPIFHVKIGNLQ